MPFTKEKRAIFERRRKQYGIVFTDMLPADKWPANHRDVFEKIEKAKQFRYSTYATEQDELDRSPWKGDAKIQARKLVEAARDCASRNEPTWRHACEPLVFSRLSAEVACKNCRKRVWRSEIETTLGSDASSAAANLRQRQRNRERCRCPRTTRPGDEDERVGLNKLFIDRAEDKVVHPLDLAQKLPQEQRPDRIFGLRQTRNLESLLLKEIGNDQFLEDELHDQPHSNISGEALLFPFLVVEAKSGNAPDDWSSICLQTAFPIYTYLNMQQSLRSATKEKSKWESGPLVWFFMSRGEDWRLCLAYQVPRNSHRRLSNTAQHTTEIVRVWTGSITNRDDALQLFLLVDFISGWARDTYRMGVLTELRTLASVDTELVSAKSDISTVFTDTDIYSSRSVLPVLSSVDTTTSESQADGSDIQMAFRGLDNQSGNVRHISSIRSRFLSFFLTADNIHTFIYSLNPSTRTLVIRRLLDQFHSPFQTPSLITLDCLSGIEQIWTKHSRSGASFNLRGTRFYTVHAITYYFSISWEQIREFCVIAVSEDAFETLISESQLKVGKGKAKVPTTITDQDYLDMVGRNFTSGLSEVRGAIAQRNLLACISRVSYYIDTSADRGSGTPWFRRGSTSIWELVSYAYKYHKKGDLEPELPFLHISYSAEAQVVDTYDRRETERDDVSSIASDSLSDATRFERTHPCPLLSGHLHVSDEGAVLVHGTLHLPLHGRSSSPLCVYIVYGSTQPPGEADLARIIKRTFEDHDVYHTTRYNGTLNLQATKTYREIWNLEKPYGVFFSYGRGSFSKWLEYLNRPLPTRQGSPRGPHDSGRIIFSREYTPWHDPRLLYGGPHARRKKKFLNSLFRFEVTAWARIANEKFRRGTPCCVLCAEFGIYAEDSDEDDISYGMGRGLCENCSINLRNRWPSWMEKTIRKALARATARFSAAPEPLELASSSADYNISTPEFSPLLNSIRRRQDRPSGLEASWDSELDGPLDFSDREGSSSIAESSDIELTSSNIRESKIHTRSSSTSDVGGLAESNPPNKQDDNQLMAEAGVGKRKRGQSEEDGRGKAVMRRT